MFKTEWIKTACMYSWMGTSLGTPFIAAYYLKFLGTTVNLKCYGPGLVSNIGKNTKIRFCNSQFINQLGISVMVPICVFFGPFAIPVSILYMVISTLSYLAYVFQVYFCDDDKDNNIDNADNKNEKIISKQYVNSISDPNDLTNDSL